MSDTKTANTIARERVEDLAERRSEPAWLKGSRLAAWEAYLQMPMPDPRREEWKRAEIDQLDLSKLVAVDFGAAAKDASTLPEAFKSMLDRFPKRAGVVFQAARGAGYEELAPELVKKGVIFCSLETALAKHAELFRKSIEETGRPEKFELLNKALFNCGAFLYVPAGIEITEPFLFAVGLGPLPSAKQGAAIFPRVIVVAESQSKLNFINAMNSLAPVGASEPAEQYPYSLSDGLIDIKVRASAAVSYLELQVFEPNVFSIVRSQSSVDRDASYKSLSVALGGRQIHSELATLLQEPGASSDVLGIVFGRGRERYSFNTIQEHNGPHTDSRINFRVALKDSSSSVYQGIIRVAKGAQRTDAYQSNKNLLLGADAKADSIPKLEILTDDVKCSHGATVGPVDKEQLFYLNSRGLSEREAEEMIVFGFFNQVLEQFTIENAVEWLSEAISRKIHQN